MGKVTASIDTTHYKGTITKSVRVTTNDPAESVFSLMLSADVVRVIDVLPTDSLALIGRPEQIRPAQLTLAATDGKPFDVLRVESDPRLAVTVAPAPGAPTRRHQKTKGREGLPPPVATGSARYAVAVNVKPDVQFGHGLALVTLATSNRKEPTIPIRVTLAIQGPLVAYPEAVFLRPGIGVQHVALRRSDDVELKIEGIESTSPDLKTTLKTVKAGHEYDLAIEYTGQPGKPVAARITVHTNEPKQRDVVITVSGRV